jgi:hypothetical protein
MRLVDELRTAVEKSSLSVFNGMIYIFTGSIYEKISRPDFDNMTYELWKQLGLPLTMWDNKGGGVVDLMRTMVFSKHIYPDNSRIVFENGMYDFDAHTVSRRKSRKRRFSSPRLPFKYNSFAVCPKWDKFLDTRSSGQGCTGYVAGVLGKHLH